MFRLLCFLRDKILPRKLAWKLDDYIFVKYEGGKVELEVCTKEETF